MGLPICDWQHVFISLGARNEDETERQRGILAVMPWWPKGTEKGLDGKIIMCVL